MEKILVLDFGGQTCQLIARRIREIGVYSEVVPDDPLVESCPLKALNGFSLSGEPLLVYEDGNPTGHSCVSSHSTSFEASRCKI